MKLPKPNVLLSGYIPLQATQLGGACEIGDTGRGPGLGDIGNIEFIFLRHGRNQNW